MPNHDDIRNIPLLRDLVNVAADMANFIFTIRNDCVADHIDPYKDEYAEGAILLTNRWNTFWSMLNETNSNSGDMPVVYPGMPQSTSTWGGDYPTTPDVVDYSENDSNH